MKMVESGRVRYRKEHSKKSVCAVDITGDVIRAEPEFARYRADRRPVLELLLYVSLLRRGVLSGV